MTGVSAGITEAFIVSSFELVKIRLQDKANVNNSRFNNMSRLGNIQGQLIASRKFTRKKESLHSAKVNTT